MPAKKRKRATAQQIAALALKQDFRCGICHFALCAHDVEVDHIVPVARGGGNARRNLRVVHGVCNRVRGARL